MQIKSLIFMSLFVCIASCSTQNVNALPIESAVGWLHGNCLAIQNDALKSNDLLNIVLLENEPAKVAARISGKAQDGTSCYALMEDRRDINQSAGYTFYTVKADTNINLAIGIVAAAKNKKLVAALNNNLAGFTYCSSSEGVHYSMWSKSPYTSEKLWSAYYYLGYESEADCPALQ
ncbi:hypothetical protein LZP73_16905 [Shewanella sp. AS16]|uniref:hypothetical protein n=1 Tax=Shewanella sp. AS16 TaxID=2907625 RepID=UPI001F3C02CF|nr:hypothetical protein [Shewanella sp. AS16]MCE9687861.1 hypothetical protein [Shewanella sp. AS16]